MENNRRHITGSSWIAVLTIAFMGLVRYAAAASNAQSAQPVKTGLSATMVLPQSVNELRMGLLNHSDMYFGTGQAQDALFLGDVVREIAQAHPGNDVIYTSHGDRAMILPYQALAAQALVGASPERPITFGVYDKRHPDKASYRTLQLSQEAAGKMLEQLSRGDVAGVYSGLLGIFDHYVYSSEPGTVPTVQSGAGAALRRSIR